MRHLSYTASMLAEDVMSRTLVTVATQATLRDAVDLLRSHGVRHLPVLDGSTLAGIVTDRDVKRATPSVLSGIERDQYDHVLETIRVAQIMTREPVTVAPRTSLKAVVELLLQRRIGAVPVVEDGRLVGIVSERDVLRVAYSLLPD
jgi:CBS domain-containing protein